MFFSKVFGRILSKLLIISLIFGMLGSFAVSADKGELIENGGFEQLNPNGSPLGWSFSGGAFGTDFFISTEKPHSGSNSLKIATEEESVFASCQIYGLVKGEKYELKLSVKTVKQNGNGAAVKLEFYDTDDKGDYSYLSEKEIQKEYQGLRKNLWHEQVEEFTAPAATVAVLLRFYGGGEMYFDDVSIYGERAKTSETKKDDSVNIAMNIKPPVPGAENLIKNNSFEDADASGGAEGWQVFSGEWGGKAPVALTDKDAYDGKTAVRIVADETQNPWVCYEIDNLTPGAEYQLSAWLKQISVQVTGAVFKLEFYQEDGINKDNYTFLDEQTIYFAPRLNEWYQVAESFVPPPGSQMVKTYLRLYGPGEILWDKAECYVTREAPKVIFETDQFFYYTEWDKGEATVKPSTVISTPDGCTVDFSLTDSEGRVLESSKGVPLGDGASFSFDVSSLKEKGKPYSIVFECRDAEGDMYEEGSETVYRYDRPEAINENGVYIKDGKPFFPVVGYHVEHNKSDYAYCNQAGVNVVQFFPGTDASVVNKQLDLMAEHGIMAIIALYTGMKPAGHPSNAGLTEKIVSIVKDHPATFGYMVMDEPFANGCKEEDLRNSYKIIRDMDSKHPVYMVEAPALKGRYRLVGKCADILAVDPYPAGDNPPESYITEHVRAAKEAVYDKKPVYCINQAFRSEFNPSAEDIRHMNYQALFEGAEGLGYYDIRDYYGYNNGAMEHIWQRDCWPGVKGFAENEAADAFKAFVLGEYPVLNEQKGDEIWWRSEVRGKDIYVTALNMTAEKQNVSLPIESFDGAVKVGEFIAQPLYMKDSAAASGRDALPVSLSPGQPAVYKVTPKNPINFGVLTKGRFRDLGGYSWARKEIETLDAKGIINALGARVYHPGEKITRADFAMFLIRTLGLKSDSKELFADVKGDAYYARELATGKALGILKGVGDNTFNPNAEISRQDMMVICARGMEYASKLVKQENEFETDSFSDASLIADYAAGPISAMVKAGIVLGNADGTINPRGNATRAEAAVIMYRILNIGDI